MSAPSAQLWLGDKDILQAAIEQYITALFLTVPGGAVLCPGLSSVQLHPMVRWLKPPEKGGYKRADFELLMIEVQRKHGNHDPLVVVIEDAQRLNDSCANALLKVLEEPVEGVFFILGTPARDLVISTIVSRTLIVDKRTSSFLARKAPLVEFFSKVKTATFEEFSQLLEVAVVDESNTSLMLDQLLISWHEAHKQALMSKDQVLSARADRVLRILLRSKERSPMPGSVKLFWRNLFMMFSA